MVIEAAAVSSSQAAPGQASGSLEFEIVDQTSAEQVAREEHLLAPAEVGDTANDTQSGDDIVQGPADEPDDLPVNESRSDAQARIRTYSQAEVSKMQAAWARQIDDARRTAARADDQLERFNMDAAVEAMLKKQEQELAADIGPDQAAKMVRSPQNAALVRRSMESQRLLQRSENERVKAIEQQERQARFVVAQALAREHGVASEDFDLLASASTPRAMQSLARRLGGGGVAAMRNTVPPETAQTQLENSYHAGPAPENSERRLERIRSKPAWEWTEADLRYMKTGEVR